MRRRLVAVTLIVLTVGIVAGAVYWRISNQSEPQGPPTPDDSRSTADPRLAYSGPYKNIHPSIKYVGADECAFCHATHADSFAQHPMGRSMTPAAEMVVDDGRPTAPFAALGAMFRIERDGDRLRHVEFRRDADDRTICDRSYDIQYAVGSATHGQSFLSVRDGWVIQSPATWFPQRKKWDQSPGWSEIGGGRPVEHRCLFCHTDRVEPIAGSLNRYREPLTQHAAIGCERCHGPGELHAAHWGAPGKPSDDAEHTIVNPRKLDWKAREDVCRQCHSEGESRLVRRGRDMFDYRPGMRLSDFWSIAVRSAGDEEFKVVNHVEQMERSGCFQKSPDSNKLGCISCHNPHEKPAAEQRVAHFRQACLKCHSDRGCTVPETKRRTTYADDSCIACHMPKEATQDVPHVTGTDHRIPRRPIPQGQEPHDDQRVSSDQLPLRLIHRQRDEHPNAEERRDLAIMAAELLTANRLPRRHSAAVLNWASEALQQEPNDAAAWEAKGIALQASNRPIEAMTAYRESLKLEPNRERCLSYAADLSFMMKRIDDAAAFWEKAVKANPWRASYRAGLTVAYASMQRWRDGLEHINRWVELEPGVAEARRLRTLYFLRLEQYPDADREYAVLESLRPAKIESIRDWWKEELSRRKGRP